MAPAPGEPLVSRLIDVSLPIGPDLLVFPGNPAPEVLPALRIFRGDEANVSELRIGTHTGTHVDPPVHFVEGAEGIDRMPLDVLVGPALVADLRGLRGPLSPEALESAVARGRGDRPLQAGGSPAGPERLLLRTDNSDLWRRLPAAFPDEYVCLSADAARWVVDRGIRLVGIDFLSIEQRGAEGHPVHNTLLRSGVAIVEGLDLGAVEPGPYTLLCLPLRVVDGDGGPARTALIRD